jgi:hypothetical protein
MTNRTVRHIASLVLVAVFAVASIGGDGCFGDWGTPATPPSSANLGCSNPGYQRYACVVALYGLKPGVCEVGPYETTCSANFAVTPCASSVESAQNDAAALAKGMAVNGKFLTPQCAILPLYSDQPIYNDLVLDGSCTCSDGTGGGSTGPSCLSDGDICSADADCCSAMCSDQGACESCRSDLEGCVHNADCCSGICSINACGGNALHLPDGGSP